MVQKSALVVAVVGVVLLGAAAAAPYWFGMQAEEVYNKNLQEIAKDGQVAITRQTYERGWLNSTAEATYTFGGLPVSLTVISKIYHGPIPLTGALELKPVLALIKGQATLTLPLPIKLPPIHGTTVIHLEGDSETHFEVAAANSNDPSGASVSWQGLTGDVTTSADLKQLTMNILSPLLQINSPTQKFSLAKGKITANLQRSASGLTTGNLSYAIDKVSSESEKGNMVMNGLMLATSSSEAAGNLSVSVDLKLQSIGDGATSYGPGQLSIKMRNLDTATLVKYQKDMRTMQAKKLPPEQMPSVLMGKMLELVTSLAKKAPEIEVSKISFKFKDGEITGNGKLVLDGNKTDIGENPGLLLMALSGQGEVLVPQAALKALTAIDLSRQLETYKSQGRFSEEEMKKLTPQKVSEISLAAAPKFMDRYAADMKLVPDGDAYKISMSLSHGQFLLNGQPLSQSVPIP
jgi:uncharacterized protein YdgA (DUF945 family)